ncbi:adenine phosphoribosyltransferase [Jatrophihabitans endophyticus]|uniref:adenine phosphoribosyltransferase n=1 Tax=Jatrophihabitans endophyticus TaxID=1206085 RepID=UPI001A01196F|nr:adenine phosphoribosyltransferase [Jatrophihabitans endophyticus]MBE7190220.1 adenine phosphoribosyltransferase [Jatrophihabitans endophyticus]
MADTLGERINGLLRDVPDFPEPGIGFKDISPLLADARAFDEVVDGLAGVARLGDAEIDLVAGVEARGFLIAGALACRLGAGLVPVRKAGKLPPPTLTRSYDLEYGSAEIEVPSGVLDGRRVLLVDDVLATGGTLRAAAELVGQAGGTVTALAVIVELGFLGGRDALNGLAPLHSLLTL